jgi:hypothetical protein
VSRLKKKLLECSIHGLTLFRCKRKCWKGSSKKEKAYADEYTEKCFKCINEGLYNKSLKKEPKSKRHVFIKID